MDEYPVGSRPMFHLIFQIIYMGTFNVDKTPFTLKIAFHCSEYVCIIGVYNYFMSHLHHLKHFKFSCKNHYDNFVWHSMLNHSIVDLRMLKYTHLKYLNHLDFVLQYLCTVCVYRKDTFECRLNTCCIGTQVMISPSSFKIVWIVCSQCLLIIGW